MDQEPTAAGGSRNTSTQIKTLFLNAAGKKCHFLRGESICPGLHAMGNDYTAGEDTFPSKATSRVGCVGAGPGLTQSQEALQQHWKSPMDGWIWTPALLLAATLHLLLVLENGETPTQHRDPCSL